MVGSSPSNSLVNCLYHLVPKSLLQHVRWIVISFSYRFEHFTDSMQMDFALKFTTCLK